MEDQFRVFEKKLQLVGLEKLPDGNFNKIFRCKQSDNLMKFQDVEDIWCKQAIIVKFRNLEVIFKIVLQGFKIALSFVFQIMLTTIFFKVWLTIIESELRIRKVKF